MAVTYPRTLPSFVKGFDGFALDLIYPVGQNRTNGGDVIRVQYAAPYWTMDWPTPPLSRADKAALQAWWMSLGGGRKTFFAYHPFRQWPTNYATETAVLALTRAGGGAFDGTFEITGAPTARAMTSSTSATTRAPASLVLTAGDMIGVSQSGKYSLHRVTETVTATAGGAFTTADANEIAIEPPLQPTIFTASVGGGLIANIIRPVAEFVPAADKWSSPETVVASPARFGGNSLVF